jgi:hypothetical protein
MIREEFIIESIIKYMAESIPQILANYSEELAVVVLISGIDDCLVFIKKCCISEVVARLVLNIFKEYPSVFIYDKFAISCDNRSSILQVLERNNSVNGDPKEVIIPSDYYFGVIPVSLVCEVEQLVNVYRQEYKQFKISIRTL